VQNQIETRSVEQSFSFGAAQTHCSVALPYVDPLSSFLVGQPILLKGKAKRLLDTPLPHINSVDLHYKEISNVLIEGIESGALTAKDVQSIIDGFNDKTSARKIIHKVNVKIRNHAIADELNLIKKNAVDIYEKIHSLGYETETLDVADVLYDDNILKLEFSEPLSICNYDDRNLPYCVQLCVAAVARYFGLLCSTSPADHFINYSDDFETISELSKTEQKKLLALDSTQSDQDYINEFRNVMPTEQFDEYVETLESYYAYCFEEEEHHPDIAHMIKEAVTKLAFINSDQFNTYNYYPLKSSKKLLARVTRLAKKYESSPLSMLVNKLLTLCQIAHSFKNLSTYDFEFEGEVYDLSYHQAITFKSLESDYMWREFSESEKHIMETGDYAILIMPIGDPNFMAALRNHQLGWLLGHCLTQLLTEYQENV